MGEMPAAVLKEYEEWQQDHPAGYEVVPAGDNGYRWYCRIPGKEGTPWAGTYYRVQVDFARDHPQSPPRCTFYPPLFHPNVYPSGRVALSLLEEAKHEWDCTTRIRELLVRLQALLARPVRRDYVNGQAYTMYCDAVDDYNRLVHQHTMALAAHQGTIEAALRLSTHAAALKRIGAV